MRVLVSGCFDLLHAGHIAFLNAASAYGDLTVSVGRSSTVAALKGHWPILSESERVYIVQAIGTVDRAVIAPGSGMFDFEKLLADTDYFVVNTDGHTPEKEALVREAGVQYIVLDRIPPRGLPARTSTEIREKTLPYRISLAGGWIDQPWVSKLCPGSMVVVQIEPTHIFDERSGLATSTRKNIPEIWGNRLPESRDQIARTLFAADNPPGTEKVSGSQDAIGLSYSGISRLDYAGEYWPEKITSTLTPDTLDWFESVIHLVPQGPRDDNYNPLHGMNLTEKYVRNLGEAGRACWNAILDRDTLLLGDSLIKTQYAYKHLFPATVWDEYPYEFCLPTGAGGGGYLVVVSEDEVPDALSIKVKRS